MKKIVKGTLICPICENKIKVKLNKKNEIFVCSFCETSIFASVNKNKVINAIPIILDLKIKGAKTIPNISIQTPDDDIVDSIEDYEDFY